MGVPYAEVVGHPIKHSKSPLIHGFWLEKLGLAGDYRAVDVSPGAVEHYIARRRFDFWWRGCNVTAPLKEEAAANVPAPIGLCDHLGAVNVITRTPLGCVIGTNTDLAGIAEALAGARIEGADVLLMGAGGAARAALCVLARGAPQRITILNRSRERAEGLRGLAPGIEIDVRSDAGGAAAAAGLIVNATSLGSIGQPPMHRAVLDELSAGGAGKFVFDMVYAPLDTELLAAARAGGAGTADGLAMLVGQAAPAFELFFGARAPREHDAELRELLVA